MRVAILDDWEGVALASADWAPVGDVTVLAEPVDPTTLTGYDCVVVMRERTQFPRAVLESLPDLRLLVTTGSANAAIDLRACSDLGITVSGTGSLDGGPVELTWALILAAARRLDLAFHDMRQGRWTPRAGTLLAGRTLGVLGLGKIGSRVAMIGSAFGMEVLAWSPTLTAERAAEHGARSAGLDELLAASDVVTVHLAMNEATRGLVGAREIGLIGSSAWLVNTSRAAIVDTAALVAACASGAIAGAALDVFDQEPLAADALVRGLDNVLLTPHLGYSTNEQFRLWFGDVVEDILAFANGSPIRILTTR